MRIIPVLDVARGTAVHAVAGERAHYAPLQSVLTTGTADPLALAVAFREHLGLSTLYLADLDAISGAAPHQSLIHALQERHMTLWLDAGVRDAADLEHIPANGEVILGLETLAGPEALARCLERRETAIWSLDLRDGRPILATGADWGTDDPLKLAELAVSMGVNRAIVLDLARVGTGRGVAPTAALVSRLKARHPSVSWYAGGGVAGEADLEVLARAGADAVLIGSALHDGRLDAAAVARRHDYRGDSR
jgi:phosphoribosylformimino-5-aminoimidazole carboxamide ribotide isomerase